MVRIASEGGLALFPLGAGKTHPTGQIPYQDGAVFNPLLSLLTYYFLPCRNPFQLPAPPAR
eukprot:377578-Rhodomonas_salina.4